MDAISLAKKADYYWQQRQLPAAIALWKQALKNGYYSEGMVLKLKAAEQILQNCQQLVQAAKRHIAQNHLGRAAVLAEKAFAQYPYFLEVQELLLFLDKQKPFPIEQTPVLMSRHDLNKMLEIRRLEEAKQKFESFISEIEKIPIS